MNLRFGDFGVRSGQVGFVLYEVKTVTGESARGRKPLQENIGKEVERVVGYYSKASQALDALLQHDLNASGITSVSAAIEWINKFEEFIKSVDGQAALQAKGGDIPEEAEA
jgi:hypothetical protein